MKNIKSQHDPVVDPLPEYPDFTFQNEEDMNNALVIEKIFKSNDFSAPIKRFITNLGYTSFYEANEIIYKQEGLGGSSWSALVYNPTTTVGRGYTARNGKLCIMGDDIEIGTAERYDIKPIQTMSVWVSNYGDTEDTQVAKFDYNRQESWSRKDLFSFTDKVSLTQSFKVSLNFEGAGVETTTSINAEFSATSGWEEQVGETETISSTAEYRALIPAKSKRLITLTLFKESVVIPYITKMCYLFDLSTFGFVRPDPDNALPQISGLGVNYKSVVWNGEGSDLPSLDIKESLRSRYYHPDQYWPIQIDWEWLFDQYGKEKIKNNLAEVARYYKQKVAGEFNCIAAMHYEVTAGKPEPLPNDDITKLKGWTSEIVSGGGDSKDGLIRNLRVSLVPLKD